MLLVMRAMWTNKLSSLSACAHLRCLETWSVSTLSCSAILWNVSILSWQTKRNHIFAGIP